MRGVPQSGLWSEWAGTLLQPYDLQPPGMPPVSGTGSERAKVASVAVAEPPREPGPPVPGALIWGTRCFRLSRFPDLLRQLVGPPRRVGNPVAGTEGKDEQDR
jgi:hypothetical protein